MTNSTEAFEVLWDSHFTYRSRINREPSALYEAPNFFRDVMANRTRIDEEDYLQTSLLHEFLDRIKNELLCM
jgi:hypothetical protein